MTERATNKPPFAAKFDFRLQRRGLVPRSTEKITLPEGAKEHLGALALDIFIHASNHGQVFQEALLAVYLSGLNHGAASAKETRP